jgi:hypothetical protein
MGINSSRQVRSGCEYSRHAEVDAIMGLPPPDDRSKRKNSRYKKTVDILVIRVTKSGLIRSSDPCFKCIEHMQGIRSYRIRYVYFSNSEGEIERHTLDELAKSEDKHVSCRFRNHPVGSSASASASGTSGSPRSSKPRKKSKLRLGSRKR